MTGPAYRTGASDVSSTERYCARCSQPADEAASPPTAGAVAERAVVSADVLPTRRDWKGYLGKVLCWGAPLLIVAVLVVGGTRTGWVSAGLPFLAALACPLGMYFMMRSMSKMGDHGDSKAAGRDR